MQTYTGQNFNRCWTGQEFLATTGVRYYKETDVDKSETGWVYINSLAIAQKLAQLASVGGLYPAIHEPGDKITNFVTRRHHARFVSFADKLTIFATLRNQTTRIVTGSITLLRDLLYTLEQSKTMISHP